MKSCLGSELQNNTVSEMPVFLTTIAWSVLWLFATATPTPDPLSQAQMENQKAQTEYYKKQIDKRQRVLNALPAVGASIAAVVALLSLVSNLRVTLRSQQDTQFYEALKRFGDKDSPQTRSIAAALLAEMASNRRRYFETTIDTFLVGLLMEEDDVALNSIATSLRQIVRRNPKKSSPKLASINRNLSHSLAKCLAKYLVNEKNAEKEEDKTWKKVEESTKYGRKELENLFSDKYEVGTLGDELAAAQLMYGGYSMALAPELKVTAKRLRLIREFTNMGCKSPAASSPSSELLSKER